MTSCRFETAAAPSPPAAAVAPPPPAATGGGGDDPGSPPGGTIPAQPSPGRPPGVPGSWVEQYIAEREAARAFLTAAGHVVQLADGPESHSAITAFRVSGYVGHVFYNEDLVALARHLGWGGLDG